MFLREGAAMDRRFLFTILAGFLLVVLSTPAVLYAQDTGSAPLLRQRTDLVTVDVTVTDARNRVIAGLGKSEFELYEDKVQQQLEFFAVKDLPARVGIVFDISSSMQLKLKKSLEALRAFIATSHPDDNFLVVAFNQSPKLIADSTDGESVVARLSAQKTSGKTALYDAVYLGLERLQVETARRKVMVVVTDGEDNNSRYSLRDVTRLATEADVTIYFLSITEAVESTCTRLCQMNARRAMEQIASKTGGTSFFPAFLDEMYSAAEKIALEIRGMYSLGYVPTNPERDGKWRRIRVQVREPGAKAKLNIRSRDGYFAGR